MHIYTTKPLHVFHWHTRLASFGVGFTSPSCLFLLGRVERNLNCTRMRTHTHTHTHNHATQRLCDYLQLPLRALCPTVLPTRHRGVLCSLACALLVLLGTKPTIGTSLTPVKNCTHLVVFPSQAQPATCLPACGNGRGTVGKCHQVHRRIALPRNRKTIRKQLGSDDVACD